MSTLVSPAPRRTATHHRIAAAALGAAALLFLAVGSIGLYGELKKDDDGYLSTGYHRFATERSAIATDELDLDAGGAGWVVGHDGYGKARVQVRGAAARPVFVGIARSRDVDAFLSGADHARLRDVDYSPFAADLVDHPSAFRPGLPAGRSIWAASSSGTGTRTVTWDVRHGNWSVVVMNADASPGVDVRVRVGANVPVLTDIAWTALGLGLVTAIAAGGVLVVARRRTG
jgi:hypothetical protein